jgi:MFS family permease
VFWPIVLPTGFCLALSVTLLTNLVPLAIDGGVEPRSAAYLASLVALSALVGKVGFGFIADIASQRSMVWVPSSLACCACLLLLGDAGYARLVGAALLLGFAFGSATPAWGALVGANFGRSGFSLAMGLMTPVVSVLLATCVPFAAWVHDRTGSYDSAWLVMAVLMAALAMMGRRLPHAA